MPLTTTNAHFIGYKLTRVAGSWTFNKRLRASGCLIQGRMCGYEVREDRLCLTVEMTRAVNVFGKAIEFTSQSIRLVIALPMLMTLLPDKLVFENDCWIEKQQT